MLFLDKGHEHRSETTTVFVLETKDLDDMAVIHGQFHYILLLELFNKLAYGEYREQPVQPLRDEVKF